MYNPILGTFTNRDPIAADKNLYRYVGSQPTTATDPSGLADLTNEFYGMSSEKAAHTANEIVAIYQKQIETRRRELEELAAENRRYWETTGRDEVNRLDVLGFIQAWRGGKLAPVVVLDGTSGLTAQMRNTPTMYRMRRALFDGFTDSLLQAAKQRQNNLPYSGSWFQQRGYGHPATGTQLAADVWDMAVNNSAPAFVGSYSARGQMDYRRVILKRDPKIFYGDGVDVASYTLKFSFEIFNPVNNKSGTLPPWKLSPDDTKVISNEIRPFYPHADVDQYFRWSEEAVITLCRHRSDGFVTIRYDEFPRFRHIAIAGSGWHIDNGWKTLSAIGGQQLTSHNELSTYPNVPRPPNNYDNTNDPAYYHLILGVRRNDTVLSGGKNGKEVSQADVQD